MRRTIGNAREQKVHHSFGGDSFEAIIEANQLRTHFQPIVELEEGHLFGFESLSRGPLKTVYESPDVLFGEARRRHLLLQLETKCQCQLLANIREIAHRGFYMFVNLEPILLETEDFRTLPIFESLHKIDPRNFVIELTERHKRHAEGSLKRNLEYLRSLGFRIALDDVGSGYSDLDSIVEFRPEFLKISNKIIQDISTNTLKQKVVSLLLELSDNFAFTIAEGIETERDFFTVRELGVRFGQGFLLAKPNPEMSYSRQMHLYTAAQSGYNWDSTLPQVS